MKLMWKLLLTVLVISLLLPFTLLRDDTGNTLLDFSNFKWPDWRKSTKIILNAFESSDPTPESVDIIYQWVDAEGNIQFSNTPPPEGIKFSVKNYDPELNNIQSVTSKTGEVNGSVVPINDPPENKFTTTEDLGSPYSADGIEKLFEDANNIEKLLNQRLLKQEAALGQ